MRRFVLVLSILISTLGLCGYYIGNRLMAGSTLLASQPGLLWMAVILFLGLVILGPSLSHILPKSLSGRFFGLRWLINMTMAIFFGALFYFLITDLGFYLLRFVIPIEVVAIIQSWSLSLVLIAVAVTLIVGTIQALEPKIFRVDVPLKGLPPAFDGFTIAQISDLHIGEMIGHSYVRAVVEKTNALNPNIVAMTGDIIDGAAELVLPIALELAALKATDGIFYVTGNHEYYWGVENALNAMKRAGAKILLNESVRIHRGASEIVIAGVTDISAGHGVPGHKSDPEKSVAGVSADKTRILLAHQPASFRSATKAGFNLQLSGHTHGGQFFPWSLVVRLFQRYNKGLSRRGDLWIYVNRGTATWGPRVRFGIPPEITLLTLRRPL